MYKYFFYLTSVIFFIPFLGASANSDNITSPDFKITTGKFDPMNPKPEAQTGGISAAKSLLGSITELLLFLIPIIAGISLIIAGYYYILSSGDTEKATQAKTIIKWNLIAIVIAILSYSIILLIATFLDGSIT